MLVSTTIMLVFRSFRAGRACLFESHYGMGWRVLDNHGQKIVYHGGYVNGYRSEIAFSPEHGVGICILINANSSYPLEVIPDFFNYFKPDQVTATKD